MIRFTLLPTGNAIAFPDDDAGERIDEIETAFARAAGFQRERSWSTPLEEIRLLSGRLGSVLLRWDGYATDIVAAQGSAVCLSDLAAALDRDESFIRA